MLRVWSDILAAYSQEVTLLGLLYLSSAFDCVDLEILMQWLEIGVGLSGVVLLLHWIWSLLADRTQQVAYNGRLSPVSVILYGVPQGSVLEPLLYLLYTAELNYVVAHYHLHLHQYADDCQIYASSLVDKVTALVHRPALLMRKIGWWRVDSDSTLQKTKLCGWAPTNYFSGSIYPVLTFCLLPVRSGVNVLTCFIFCHTNPYIYLCVEGITNLTR